MKAFIRISILLFLAASCLFMLTTCDTPLSLGNMVDTKYPVISIPDDEDSQPGAFLVGESNTIFLDVEQEFGIDTVYMTMEFVEDSDPPQKHVVTIPARWDAAHGAYAVDINTKEFELSDGRKVAMRDGSIKTTVTAIDTSGKKTTTTEILYYVKNTPPQIQFTIPSLKGDGFDKPNMNTLLATDQIIIPMDIMGIAEDFMGIKSGYPIIQFWRADDPSLDANGFPSSSTSRRYSDWYSMEVPSTWSDNENDPNYDRMMVTKITWPTVKLIYKNGVNDSDGYRLPNQPGDPRAEPLDPGPYRLRVITMDTKDNPNYYPNRINNTLGVDYQDHPNQYMQVDLVNPAVPIVTIGDPPTYYNGVNDFEVPVRITSGQPVTQVWAYITDINDDNPNYKQKYELYDVTAMPILEPEDWDSIGSSYYFTLKITPEQAQLWPKLPNAEGENGGNLYLYVYAADTAGKDSPESYRQFIYDVDAPKVKFDRPTNRIELKKEGTLTDGKYAIYYPNVSSGQYRPNWVTGQITVGGTSVDKISVSKVYYHIGKLGDDNMGLTDAQRELLYGSATDIDSDIWTDTLLDSPEPLLNWSGSIYSWNYTFDFNGFKPQTALIQEDTEIFSGGEINQYNNTTGKTRFYLPFYVKVLDSAKNQTVVHYKLCIDPDLDDPIVTISYPYEETPPALVGGEVRLNGNASDNDWVHSVMIRIKRDDTAAGVYYIPDGATRYYSLNPGAPGYDEPNADGWFLAKPIGDGMAIGWYYNINADEGLNPAGANTSVGVTIEVRAMDTKDEINRQIIPTGMPKASVVGNTETLIVTFSSQVPTIEQVKIKKDNVPEREYFEGIRASGEFKISMVIRDPDGFRDVTASFNNVRPMTALIKDTVIQTGLPTGWSITTPAMVGGKWQSTVEFVIKSTDMPNLGYGSTGVMPLDMQVINTNANSFTTNGTYKVEIDNFYPSTEIRTASNASGNIFLVEGLAKDYGAGSGGIQGLERVLVFFEKAQIVYTGEVRTVESLSPQQFLNPRGKRIPLYGAGDNITSDYVDSDFYSEPQDVGGGEFNYTDVGINWASSMPALEFYPNMRVNGGGDPYGPNGPNCSGVATDASAFKTFPVLKLISKGGNVGDVWESPHAMVIDSQELGEDVDLDKDGTKGEVWQGLADKEWGARLDTTNFDNGPLIVHYIVMDKAGNSTHYKRDTYIENDKPGIESINLGIDLFGAGSMRPWVDNRPSGGELEPGDFMDNNFPVSDTEAGARQIQFNPAFRIRNNYFGIRLFTSSGIGTKNYKASYVTRNAAPIATTGMQRGEVYTIDTTGLIDFTKYGALNNILGTTFVATGTPPVPPEGVSAAGTVYSYTTIKSNRPAMAQKTNNDLCYIYFDSTDFTTAPVIPDSPKTGGEVTNHNARLFIVKVFDSSVGGAAREADQLAHAVLVAVDIDNTDEKAPTLQNAPMGMEYSLRAGATATYANDSDKTLRLFSDNGSEYYKNIVTSVSGPSAQRKDYLGYVQYARHSTEDTHSNLSGKVIFTGKAADNQRISHITAQITNFNGGTPAVGSEFRIAEWDTVNHVMKTPNPDNTIAKLAADTAPNNWAFEANNEYLTLDHGHAIDWKFAFDTAKIINTVMSDIHVTFRVYDSTTVPAGAPVINSESFNVVPYILEVETSLSGANKANPSAFNRSARGWYPVRENDTIVIRGFNFIDGDSTNVSIGGNSTELSGTALNYGTASPPALGSYKVDSANQITANIGTSAASGELVVWVRGVASINNKTMHYEPTDPAKKILYNWEPNDLNNNSLDNKRNLYVWNAGYLLNQSSSLTSPFFRMDPKNAVRYMSFGNYTTRGDIHIQVNNGDGGSNGLTYNNTTALGRSLGNNNNRYLNTTLAIGGSSDYYVASSNQTQGNQPFTLYTLAGTTVGTRNLVYSGTGTGADPNKIKIPRIFIQPTSSGIPRVLMSYYDSYRKQVVLRYGGRQNATTNTFNGGIQNVAAPSGNNEAVATGGETVSTGTYQGSIYTAVGALSNGRPVIAWYDEPNGNLVFAWNSVAPTSAAYGTSIYPASYSWTYNIIPNPDGSSGARNGMGAHVDMAVDENDNVHLAYFDTNNGGLYYVRIPATNAGAASAVPNMSGVVPVRVDTYLAAGTKIMLNLRKETINSISRIVPYISYFHGSFSETRNSIRVAWQKIFPAENGTDERDMFTGAWEVMTVPVLNIPAATEMICNGVPTGSGSWANVTTTGTTTSGGPLAKRTATDITKSVILAYMTNMYYEGAILNGDLTALDQP